MFFKQKFIIFLDSETALKILWVFACEDHPQTFGLKKTVKLFPVPGYWRGESDKTAAGLVKQSRHKVPIY